MSGMADEQTTTESTDPAAQTSADAEAAAEMLGISNADNNDGPLKEDPYDFDEPEDDIPSGSDAGTEDRETSDAAEEKVDPDLLTRAKELGLEDDALDGLTPKAVQNLVTIAERASASVEDSGGSDATTDTVDETLEPLEITLDEDLHDPDVVQVVKALTDEVNRLRSVVGGLEGQATLARQEQIATRFDKTVTDLSAYGKELGEGPTDRLGSRTKHAQNRVALRDEIQALRAGYEATGKKVPTESELALRAARGLFGEPKPAQTQESVEDAVRDRQGRFVARPGARKVMANAKSPEHRAALAVAELMDAQGTRGGVDMDDEF